MTRERATHGLRTGKAMMLAVMVCVLFGAPSLLAGDDKKEVKWSDFDSGFAEAKKTDKKVLLDIYTDWCGWCKRLDKDVYSNDTIARYLSKKYVTIKLNAESNKAIHYKDTTFSEAGLAHAFGVNGYPTVIIFDSKGEPLTFLSGYKGPDWYLPVLNFIGEDIYKTMKWEDYERQGKPAETQKNKP